MATHGSPHASHGRSSTMEAGVALLLLLLLLEGVEVRRLRCHPRGLLRRVGVRVAVRERVGVEGGRHASSHPHRPATAAIARGRLLLVRPEDGGSCRRGGGRLLRPPSSTAEQEVRLAAAPTRDSDDRSGDSASTASCPAKAHQKVHLWLLLGRGGAGRWARAYLDAVRVLCGEGVDLVVPARSYCATQRVHARGCGGGRRRRRGRRSSDRGSPTTLDGRHVEAAAWRGRAGRPRGRSSASRGGRGRRRPRRRCVGIEEPAINVHELYELLGAIERAALAEAGGVRHRHRALPLATRNVVTPTIAGSEKVEFLLSKVGLPNFLQREPRARCCQGL